MTSRDFLYLGLMAVAALVCYCHGFFSGLNRARRTYEALLGSQPKESETDEAEAPGDSVPSPDWNHHRLGHLPRSRFPGPDLHDDLGNN